MIVQLLPLILFTTLSGAAAGLYAVYAIGPAGIAKEEPQGKSVWLLPVICFVLLCVGLLFTLLHLGQPMRFLNGLHNPGSMISQESYWAISLAVILFVDCLVAFIKKTEVRPLRWIGAIAAIGLMVVTSLAYYKSLGIAAWNTEATIPFFVIGDLALGCSLCLLFVKEESSTRGLSIAMIVLDVAWLAAIAAYGIALGAEGLSGIGTLVASGIIGPLASMCVAGAMVGGKIDAKRGSIIVAVLVCVGLVVCRYAFFAAGL
jgi:DMSO reductase anchor subunit